MLIHLLRQLRTKVPVKTIQYSSEIGNKFVSLFEGNWFNRVTRWCYGVQPKLDELKSTFVNNQKNKQDVYLSIRDQVENITSIYNNHNFLSRWLLGINNLL